VGGAVCSSCAAGTYATLTGSTACTGQVVSTCPAGSGIVFNQFGCYLCAINTFNAGSSSHCSSCPTGMVALTVGSASCVLSPCSIGSYTTTGTSEDCKLCPAGTYDTQFGTGSSCTLCATGKFSAAIGSSLPCTSCAAGSFIDGSGATSCTLCPAGSYTASIGSSSCSGCAAGKASSSIGAASSTTCSTCPTGSYSLKAASNCVPCSPGYYNSDEGSSFCTSCPAGTYDPYYSSTSKSSCLPCPQGTASSLTGVSECTICSAGKYSNVQGTTCLTCSAGTYSNAGVSICADCAAGSYSSTGSSFCSTCSAGTYANVRSEFCTKCVAGKYSAAGALSCSSCSAGFYSNEGSSSCSLCQAGTYTSSGGSSSCIQCPAGTYGAFSGLTSCQLCAVGYYMGTTAATSCTVCPTGSVATEGSSACTVCSSGKYASSPSTCSVCGAGTYSGGGAIACLACAAGSWSLSGSATCSFCSAGTFSSSVGLSSCQMCPAGSYSSGGATSCSLCPIGTYSTLSSAVCKSCSAGTFASSVGLSSCQICPAGSYSSGGASSCSLCPVGTYSPSVQASSSAVCQSCAAGTQQPLMGATSMDSCHSCAAGTYSDVGSERCYACRANTYSLPLSSFCTSCPSGFTSLSSSAGCSFSTPNFPSFYADSVTADNPLYASSLFNVPGADGYTLLFDSTSETEENGDFVYVFTGDSSSYVYKNSGPSWPSTFIPSNNGVKMQFTSDISVHMRGYMVTIIPNVTLTIMPSIRPSFRPSGSPSIRPTSASPTFTVEQWMCVYGSSFIDKTCSLQPSTPCIPGLVAFVGKGYDITKGTGIGGFDIGQQVQPIRGRVYDYADVAQLTTIGGTPFAYPNDVDVQPMDVTQTSDTTFNQQIDSVSSFQVSVDASVGLSAAVKANPPISQSSSSMMSMMAKGLSVSADYTKTVSSDSSNKLFSYSHFATVTKAAYNINPRSDGQICSSQFFSDLRALPLKYDDTAYFNFLSKYGTHIITGTNIGGSVRTSVSASYCSFSSAADQSAQANGFWNNMASLVSSISITSITAFSQKVTKKSSNVCGGDSAVYLNNQFNLWSSTILANPVCSNKYNLLPIWMTLSSKSPYRPNLEAATYSYIDSAISASSLSSDTVTLTCPASASLSTGSASSHRVKLFYCTPLLILVVYLMHC